MDNEKLSSHFFIVEIDGIQTARFQECEGLELESTVYEIEEGGLNTSTHKLTGRGRTKNIILKKGVTDNNELLKWYQNIIDGNFERKNGSIILMDSSYTEIKRWNFYRAFPCRWKGPSLDVHDDGYAVEMIEIVHE
jgi:phage tail-like protein